MDNTNKKVSNKSVCHQTVTNDGLFLNDDNTMPTYIVQQFHDDATFLKKPNVDVCIVLHCKLHFCYTHKQADRTTAR
jgi:hypothetical protein